MMVDNDGELVDNPFLIGYWGRYWGFARSICGTAEMQEGWDDCDDELDDGAITKG